MKGHLNRQGDEEEEAASPRGWQRYWEPLRTIPGRRVELDGTGAGAEAEEALS